MTSPPPGCVGAPFVRAGVRVVFLGRALRGELVLVEVVAVVVAVAVAVGVAGTEVGAGGTAAARTASVGVWQAPRTSNASAETLASTVETRGDGPEASAEIADMAEAYHPHPQTLRIGGGSSYTRRFDNGTPAPRPAPSEPR